MPPALNFEKLPTTDRMRDIVQALGSYIERVAVKAGDRLPPERELADALGVGRSTIRESMRQLQALGIVATRKGSGSYLQRAITSATMHMPLSIEVTTVRDALLQTLQVRRGLEVEASAVAAKHATSDDIALIEAKLGVFEAAFAAGEGAAGRADLDFHTSIYDATHNPLFRQLLEQMREGFERFFSEPFSRRDFASRSFPFHRELFDAIAAGDIAQARLKTVAILDVVEEDTLAMSRSA